MAHIKSADPFKVCTPFDPAFARHKPEVQRTLDGPYLRTRDPALIGPDLVDGDAKITWFYLRRLPRSRITSLEAVHQGNDGLMFSHAFRLGVVRVENLHRDDGTIDANWSPSWTQTTSGREEALTIDELDHFTPEEVFDIGAIVRARASLRNGKQPFFLPPESSGNACAEATVAACHYAAESQVVVSPKPAKPEATSTKTTK